MEAEFINAYIARLKQCVDETTNKLLLAEAKVSTLEKVVNDLSNKIVDYESKQVKQSENISNKSR
jgi:hypothetical protein